MKLRNLFLAIALVGAVSCGSKAQNQASDDNEINVPCSGLEFVTNADYFRANGVGISNSLQTASMKAMSSARSTLSLAIEAAVKTVADNYVSSYEENANEEARSRYQSLSRDAANQTLKGVATICQKTLQSPDGKYKCYVAIELSSEQLAKEVGDRISDDSKLRTDFEYEKFKNVFDQEMAELAK